MDISYFKEIADYNIWANNQVISWLEDIEVAKWDQPIESSFGSLSKTALHIAAAERIWLERLQSIEKPVWLPNIMQASRQDTLSIWKEASLELKHFIYARQDTALDQTLHFKRINGDPVSMQMVHILAHVFNHSTYHRGQLVVLLRQVGFTKISGTDMLRYFQL